ncbi:GntR family transcriptional regulator [Agromyces bracchium]|uniref:FCD domain-containing protein n=1 Tax=Agromyces bracchium TaxID=88376 RepID=A0A6I3M8I3_9MICO|nr:GntR family transcriptional regulator [Agromyces bracchium]MTH69281.1 FCD domain-containing protein [Agromyces bracchium]
MSANAAEANLFQVRRFSDIAVDVLRDRILSGSLQPGQRISEVALAEELRVSRPPLREALRVLHGEGLVVLTPGRGASVASFDLESVSQLGDLRIALECEIARLAAERAADDAVEAIRTEMTQIESALCDPATPYPRGVDFHGTLAAAAGNPRLATAAGDVKRQLSLARSRTGSPPERARRALDEHHAIFDAVVRRDPDAAESAMRTHMRAAMAAMIASIEAEAAGGER